MKKLLSIVLAAVMLLSALAVSAKPADERASFLPDDAAHLEGYIVGDGAGETGAKWVGFSPDNPGETEIYTFHLTTYGAAYYNGTVYGYVYGYEEDGTFHDEFYTIDLATRIPTYYEDAHSGELVYGMAYDYSTNTMYALLNDEAPWIGTVDLATGAIARVTDINLGSYLGVYGLAIDLDGNMYVMSLSAIGGKLLKVSKTNGSLTLCASTSRPCFYAQCITYDPATNRIYWAEVDGPNTYTNGLYSFDLDNNYAFNYHGVIGTNYELMAMYSTAKPEASSVTAGDINGDGTVDMQDALLALRIAMGVFTPDEDQTAAADVNGDGSVGVDDALVILRYAMGLISSL